VIPNRLAGQNKVDLLSENEADCTSENEGDCTSETGAGQFSIFGAYEEKSAHGFHVFTRMKQGLRNERLVRQMIVVLIQAEWCG
jgi:hypothetical protein